MLEINLPRMAYVGDVPIRAVSAGPALLYRLLETYPSDRLIVAESAHNAPDPSHELPGVLHERFFLMHERLLRTRFGRPYAGWTYFRARARGRALAPRLRARRAEAVLGIGHGLGWLAAAEAARVLALPLHLIVHDDWLSSTDLPPRLRPRVERAFGEVYRRAVSRMPISVEMEGHYRLAYGAGGVIVYPSQAAGALRLNRPPPPRTGGGGFTFAYAGTLASKGMRRAVIQFAHAADRLGIRLRIYQGVTTDLLRGDGLLTANVDIAPFRPADELHRDLIANVDALFLPVSFAPEDTRNVELCFSSKLADYTVVGLPILLQSPQYGAIAHWARANPGTVALVESPDEAPLAAALDRIMRDRDHRDLLAEGALLAGFRVFSHEAVYRIFCDCVTRT